LSLGFVQDQPPFDRVVAVPSEPTFIFLGKFGTLLNPPKLLRALETSTSQQRGNNNQSQQVREDESLEIRHTARNTIQSKIKVGSEGTATTLSNGGWS
jgi:hypothetical protein